MAKRRGTANDADKRALVGEFRLGHIRSDRRIRLARRLVGFSSKRRWLTKRGYPTTIGNNGNGASVLDQNMLVGFLNTSYQEDGEARKAILSYYQTLEGFIGTFLDWLSSLGLAAQIVARLKSGSIFAWPKLIQDLIILFAHDKDTANKQAPSLIPQLNQGSNVGPALGGNSLSQC